MFSGLGESETDLEDTSLDRFGFLLSVSSSQFHQSKLILDVTETKRRKAKETLRERKWLKMLKRWDFTLRFRREKLERRIRKGIPDGFRGVIWSKVLDAFSYSDDNVKRKNTLRLRYPNVYDITCVTIDMIPMQTLEEVHTLQYYHIYLL